MAARGEVATVLRLWFSRMRFLSGASGSRWMMKQRSQERRMNKKKPWIHFSCPTTSNGLQVAPHSSLSQHFSINTQDLLWRRDISSERRRRALLLVYSL